MDQQQSNNAPVEPKPSFGSVALGSFSTPEQVAFIYRVYGWMCTGLVVSGVVAYLTATTPQILDIVLGNMLVFFGLLMAEFVAVAYLARMVHTISSTTSSLIFLGYSALNGLTLSVIFLVYRLNSIEQIFFLTAGMFGAMSLYGMATKRDLTTIGHFAIMGLLGLVLSMLINLFFMNDMMNLVLSWIGVGIFVLLTAYDTQKLKWLYELGKTEGDDGEGKEAINGALTLYLDFINLFLDLLRIFGKRR